MKHLHATWRILLSNSTIWIKIIIFASLTCIHQSKTQMMVSSYMHCIKILKICKRNSKLSSRHLQIAVSHMKSGIILETHSRLEMLTSFLRNVRESHKLKITSCLYSILRIRVRQTRVSYRIWLKIQEKEMLKIFEIIQVIQITLKEISTWKGLNLL